MHPYVSFSYGVFGPLAEKSRQQTADLQKRLNKAHLPYRASAYLAALYMTALLAAFPGVMFGAALVLAIPGTPLVLKLLVPIAFGLFVGGMTIAVAPLWLENHIKEKAKLIDENLAHSINYMLALANAGLPPKEIWRALAKAKIFGPITVEAERITRDLDLFSYDILTALRLAQERTPSKPFHEFLQGAISAFQSGVELTSYLKTKGNQYQHEAEELQLKNLDTMGVLAETFLVMVVAAPLFLIILLTVMSINQGRGVILWGFVLSLVFIPLCQIIIGALISSLNPKVWT